jgi:hypothetical protein
MAVVIITKNSAVAATVPVPGQLVQGELGVNVTDKKLYTADSTGAIVTLATGVGASSVSMGTTGLTPSTPTTGAVVVAGTLALTNGGTGGTSVATAQTSLQVDPAGTAVAMAIALG